MVLRPKPGKYVQFLSTPSARRATASTRTVASPVFYFYPRPPRGGRQHYAELTGMLAEFLSTPSARRATSDYHQRSDQYYDFYPRPPRGGRRYRPATPHRRKTISIHALREEGDVLRDTFDYDISISIHALREEGDPSTSATSASSKNFYPRPPRGGRPSRWMPAYFRY